MVNGIKIINGLPDHLKDDAARLYFLAFQGKIGGILGRDGRGEKFIASGLNASHMLCALDSSGEKLLGIAGFKTSEGAMVGGELSDLAAIYGWLGAAWRGILLSLLERDLQDDVLLMDGIAVADGQRGKGIGTLLLDAMVDLAKERGKSEIRLDVINTNPKAKALYERVGFVAIGEERLGILKHVFGFSSATKMKKYL